MALVICAAAALGGSVWYGGEAKLQQGGSLTAFLDNIARWFQSVGVHPVLGAFLVGAVIAFFSARRGSSPSEPSIHEPAATAARCARVEKEIMNLHAAHEPITINGRTIDVSPEVIAHIQAGNKIEAIKALREATGMELVSAKQIVGKIAASPATR